MRPPAHDMPLTEQIAAVEEAIEEHGRATRRRAGFVGFSLARAQMQERSLRAALATLRIAHASEQCAVERLGA